MYYLCAVARSATGRVLGTDRRTPLPARKEAGWGEIPSSCLQKGVDCSPCVKSVHRSECARTRGGKGPFQGQRPFIGVAGRTLKVSQNIRCPTKFVATPAGVHMRCSQMRYNLSTSVFALAEIPGARSRGERRDAAEKILRLL
ncbi:hypothetical protein ACJJTC_004942 [Scirpophaga incertulas]